MAHDAIKCPVTLRGDAWVDIVSATGRVLATGVGRDVADAITRKLNAHEAMARYFVAIEDRRGGMNGTEWVRRYGEPDDQRSPYEIEMALKAAALAAAKGGQS